MSQSWKTLMVVVLGMLVGVSGCECGGPAGGTGGMGDAGASDAGNPTDAGSDAGTDGGATDGGDDGGSDGGATDGGDDGGSDGGGSDGGVAVLNCAVLCHGDDLTPAPPLDLRAGFALTDTGVGAHRAHLQAGTGWHRDVLCEDCHQVPVAVSDPGHIDTPVPAELTWASIASVDGAFASWNGTTCAGYCHGDTLAGGSNTTPEWTLVDGSQARCGSCHAVPPPAPHPFVTGQCGDCHPTMSTTDLSFLEPLRHIDGVLDLQVDCFSCHGDAANGNEAPPLDTRGGLDPAQPGVGAHQSHLGASGWHREVLCQSCHPVPTADGDPGHRDTQLPAELDYNQGIGEADGAAATWDSVSCSNYCHGQTLISGGSNPVPVWTNVGSGEAACGTCHGLPPAAPHPQGVTLTDCATCHPPIAADGVTFLEADRHIDGIVDIDYSAMGCTVCHGDAANGNAAPPQDTGGNTDPSAVGVGAHQQHLQQNTGWHEDVQCTDCHDVPGTVGAAGHTDTLLPAEMVWSSKAEADAATASWDSNSETCSNYCHGQTLDGGSNTNPLWTDTSGAQDACGTCHGLPPGAPHLGRTDCATCHPNIAADGTTFTQPDQHIDGNVDVTLTCTTCHGDLASGNNAPPLDTTGGGDTGQNTVGAHQSHLGGSGWHREVFCESCHLVPVTIYDPGHIDTPRPAENDWSGGLAEANGATASWDGTSSGCSNYCHGQTLAGGSNTTPTWTDLGGAQAACGTCHGTPPTPLHVGRTDCSSCHPNIAADGVTFTNPGQHIDGNLDLGPLTCVTCHGDLANGNDAPPVSTTGSADTTTSGVGAHQSHLNGSTTHGPVACAECHDVPAGVNDAGHVDTARPAEVGFGGGTVAEADGAIASYDGSSCDAYCHGQTLEGGSDTTPVWTTVDGTQGACGTCHGLPPGAPHLPQADCSRCHPNINADNATFSTPSDHVNGTVEFQLTCTSCHGDPASGDPAPPQDTQGGMASALTSVGAHQAHVSPSAWRADILCQSCHVVPNNHDDPGHRDTALPAELDWVGGIGEADAATASWNSVSCSNYCHGQTLIFGGVNLTPAWTGGATEAACGTCHGLPPSAPHVAMTDCSLCHLDATASQTIVVAQKDLHVNGVVDVDTGCSICHAQPQPVAGYRRQITTAGGDFERASHHVDDGSGSESVLDADCMVCHEQAQHMQLGNTPDVRLNDPDGLAAPFAYDGLGASVVGACVACHDSNSALAFGAQPFSDGRSPTDIATGWAISSHNVTGQPELLEDKCLACHGGDDGTAPLSRTTRDLHGATFPSLLSSRIASEVVANSEERVCLACHDATPAATNLEAEFAKGVNAAAIYHHPIVDAEQAVGREVECTDCHNPHQASSADKLRGVSGIDLAGSAVGHGTATVRAVTEYEVCFKCHGDTFNAGRPQTTNKRLDFQVANSAYHPVSGPGRNTSTAMADGLLGGLTVASVLECADCHNNEATGTTLGVASNSLASPQGPHGSSQPFVLRAAYITALNGPTNWNANNSRLCFLCHSSQPFEQEDSVLTNCLDFRSSDQSIRDNFHWFHINDKDGERISCTNCHYNTHSNEQVSTTDYLIDGTRYTSPPAMWKTRNVAFSPEVTGDNGATRPTWGYDSTTRRRTCNIDCHGKDHTENYTPNPALDDDPLAIP